MIVRNDLDGTLNELVAFFLEALAVAILASVDSAAEVIVLRRR